MKELERVLQTMDFEFFGAGKHKIDVDRLLTMGNAVFLDVRSYPEVESLQFGLKYHVEVLHIPIDEVPSRISEIPRDKTVGIFCSGGTRSAIVYAFLLTKGYENVRIVQGGYEAIANLILPGRLLKHIQKSKSGAE